MNYSKFKNGSTWRKWDLHVHTPASYGYKGNNFAEVATQIKQSDCAVVGVNDYNSLDGYAELLKHDCGNAVLLPVVEFRMSNFIQNRKNKNPGQKINFHVIFDNNLPIDRLKGWLHSLKAPRLDGTGVDRLGDIKDKGDLKNISFDYYYILSCLGEEPLTKDHHLIWVPYDEYGGIDEMSPDERMKYFYITSAHFLGSSSKKQSDFFLWRDKKFSLEEYKNFFRTKKGCIKGSDSHHWQYPIGQLMNSQSEPIEKYCWIKANPSFEGLKHVSHEPELRIRIQEEEPEQKLPYFTIKKVRFKHSRFFSDDWIELSQNLVTIIGGKSTGKSLLLYFIAKVASNLEVKKRDIDGPAYNDLEELDGFDFEIIWEDGDQSSLKKALGNEGEKERKVLYIPQHYLNRLSEKGGKQKESLNSIIFNALTQEEQLKESHGAFLNKVSHLEDEIKISIGVLFRAIEKKGQVKSKIAELGNRDGVRNFILDLEKEIATLHEKSNLSKEDSIILEESNKRVTEIQNDMRWLSADKSNITRELNDLKKHKEMMDRKLHERLFENDFVAIEARKIFSEIRNDLSRSEASFSRLGELIEQKEGMLKDELVLLKAKTGPIQEKANSSNEIKEKVNLLETEKAKLSEIENGFSLAKRHHQEAQLEFNKILSLYNDLTDLHKGLVFTINQIASFEDLSINALVGFESDIFNAEFTNAFLDKRSNLFREIMTDGEYLYNECEHKNNIKSMFTGLISGDLKLKSKKPLQNSVDHLFMNYFHITFNIRYKNDDFDVMSPGKKGLVILKFLIELSSEKWPILLDQPEDDLDNRSIYNDLVSFLRNKKTERQIIIVTHNANLVVGADSEQVIVANQSGQETFRENREKKFEYVSGALEHSFSSKSEVGVLFQKGIREHVCEILEGGVEAFQKREKKYDIPSMNFDFSGKN